eukprot:5047187-Pyramimonas_sp.AAC.1
MHSCKTFFILPRTHQRNLGRGRIWILGARLLTLSSIRDVRGTKVDVRGTNVDVKGTNVDGRGKHVDVRGRTSTILVAA